MGGLLESRPLRAPHACSSCCAICEMISSSLTSPAPRFPFSGTLAAVEDHLPSGLVSSAVRARIWNSAAAIPAAAVHHTYLECRLSTDDRVDLIVGIDVRGREALTMPSRRSAPTEATWLRSFGPGLRDLWHHWTDPRSVLHHHLGRLWLEFDADRPPAVPATQLNRAQMEGGLIEHEFDHVFLGQNNRVPSPNRDEVDDWRWMTVDALRRDLDEQPAAYTVWFKLAFTELLARGFLTN